MIGSLDGLLAHPTNQQTSGNHRRYTHMVEPLLSGIVLGFIPVTIAGLFVTAYLQYRRGDQLNL